MCTAHPRGLSVSLLSCFLLRDTAGTERTTPTCSSQCGAFRAQGSRSLQGTWLRAGSKTHSSRHTIFKGTSKKLWKAEIKATLVFDARVLKSMYLFCMVFRLLCGFGSPLIGINVKAPGTRAGIWLHSEDAGSHIRVPALGLWLGLRAPTPCKDSSGKRVPTSVTVGIRRGN